MKILPVSLTSHDTLGELSTLAKNRMDKGLQPAQHMSTLGEHLSRNEHLSRVSTLAPKVLIERLSVCRMARGFRLRCSPYRGYDNLGTRSGTPRHHKTLSRRAVSALPPATFRNIPTRTRAHPRAPAHARIPRRTPCVARIAHVARLNRKVHHA